MNTIFRFLVKQKNTKFRIFEKKMGIRLKSLISSLGITQKEFAYDLGVSPRYISDIINGRANNISPEVFYNITKKFGVNPEWILYGIGEMFSGSKENGSNVSGLVNIIGGNNKGDINIRLSGDEQELIQAVRKSKKKDILKTILNLVKILFFVSSIWLVYEAIEAMPDRPAPVKTESNQVQKDLETEKVND